MALYSVWDWNRNSWAIYRDHRPVSVGDDPTPPKPVNVGPLGADPDTQLKPLPSGARFVGHDHVCRGEVRVRSGVLGGLGLSMPDSADLPKYAVGFVVGVAAVAAWRRFVR